MQSLNTIEDEGIYLRGARYEDFNNISILYKQLNKIEFSNNNKKLLKKCEKKFIIIAEIKENNNLKIVGMDMFYINQRDFKENTVHEGFIGVLSDYEGKGIATKMRQIALKHFKENNFDGISTRISKNNLRSLNSAKKLGFNPIDEYFDKEMNEERYYLVCKFS